MLSSVKEWLTKTMCSVAGEKTQGRGRDGHTRCHLSGSDKGLSLHQLDVAAHNDAGGRDCASFRNAGSRVFDISVQETMPDLRDAVFRLATTQAKLGYEFGQCFLRMDG